MVYGKSLFTHWAISLNVYNFYTHMRNCVMGATPMIINGFELSGKGSNLK